MRSTSDTTLIAYVASPHGGYLKLFRAYEGGHLGIFGMDLIQEFPQLTKHLPGVHPADAAAMIRALRIFSSVRVFGRLDLEELSGTTVVMPDEDVSRAVAERYLAHMQVTFDGRWRLRWDWENSHHQRVPEGEIAASNSELDTAFMRSAADAAERSPDWWRQIGAVLARNGEILLTAHNTHLPSEQSAYVCGDPRSNFGTGERIDASLARHAEIGIIAEAARRGIAMEGCDLYVTTFPCPQCAYACADTGIRRLFYRDGYSLIAGADSLRAKGVELIRVA